MKVVFFRYFFTLLFLFFTMTNVQGAKFVDYTSVIKDIKVRLDSSYSLYQKKQTEKASESVLKTYWDLFEGIEGSIRRNISAKQNTKMEKIFMLIRQNMIDNRPLQEVKTNIDTLKKELDYILPFLLDEGKEIDNSKQKKK